MLVRRVFRHQRWTRHASTRVSIPVGGRPLVIETGRLARFADGCATVSVGDSTVLATAVSRLKPATSSFIPLTVDFRQKASAVGRIPTNFLRRELGQTDREILTSRLIDRSIRPLFPDGYNCETQIICNLVAFDESADPAVLSVNAASAAVAASEIPWNGPVGAVRVALIDGEVIVSPTKMQMKQSSLNLVLTGVSDERVVMIEMDGNEVSFDDLVKSINVGLEAVQQIVVGIGQLAASVGKKKRSVQKTEVTPELEASVARIAESRVWFEFSDPKHDKISRDKAIQVIREDVLAAVTSDFPNITPQMIDIAYSQLTKRIFRDLVIDSNVRCDGRGLEDFRPITCETDLYKVLHGSALFQRGQTQVMASVTFDSKQSAFRADAVSVLMGAPVHKTFMLNYEFPPYATNEIGSGRGANRRELGHGALAEKALRPVVPENFPFTIRLSCEVLESNGSSSMASACAGSLALMDAGVPLKAPVAGLAIGLVTKGDQYRILTDILGIEDYAGDMDFKMAGTSNGFTALQLDLKLPGISKEVVSEALQRGIKGKKHVLDVMARTLSSPRSTMKEGGPVSEDVPVPLHKRAQFIGAGGYNIKTIESETGVQMTQNDNNTFTLFAPNPQAMEDAKQMIDKLSEDGQEMELEFGAIYRAKVVEIIDSGVMITVKDGMRPMLLPNNQLDVRNVKHASALGIKVGDQLSVKYFGRDTTTGQHRVSRKILLTAEQGAKNLLARASQSTNPSPSSSPSPKVKTWGT